MNKYFWEWQRITSAVGIRVDELVTTSAYNYASYAQLNGQLFVGETKRAERFVLFAI